MATPKKELIKKKKWYPIVADELFNHTTVGESLVEKPQDLLGKRVVLNLMNLGGDVKKQNVWVHFEVKDIKDQRGLAQVIGYSISQSSIRRLVRRGRDRIDHSLLLVTKDGIALRLKFLLITRSGTTHAALVALRKKAVQTLQQYTTSHTYRELVSEILHGTLQDGLHGMLHKIYPLRCCEIRALRLEKNVKLTEAQQTQAQAFAQQPVQSPQTVDAVVIAPEQGTGTEVAEQHEQTPEPVAE